MKLYVGNLSRDVTEDDLREAFKAFGQVGEVTLIKDRFNGVSKGFGFVEMAEESEAKNAIAGLHRKEFKGRSLDVNEARPKTDRPRGNWGGGGGGRHSGGKRSGGGGKRW